MTPMQESYQCGRFAFAAGVREQDCPYPLSSQEALSWLDGWQDEQRDSAAQREPIVAGGQGRTAEDVKDAALNLADIGKYALAFVALAGALILFARGCIGNSPHFLVAVVCVLALSGCSGDFRKMELIDTGGRDPAATGAEYPRAACAAPPHSAPVRD